MASKKELKALITLAGKIDPSLQSAMMKASKLSSNVSKGAKKSGTELSKVGTIAKGAFLGNVAAMGVEKLGSAMIDVSKNGIELASNLSEVQNVVDTTFEASSNSINEWSQKALNDFGLSELQAKKYNSTLGAMMKSSGITGNSLVTMSEKLTGLSGDLASFYNLSQDDAFEKIRAGISGETEPLKQLGINMSVANLEAYALSKGIKTSYDKMDQASQTALRYSYLMKVSKDAQGDFAKTQEGFANQTRLLKTNFEQLSSKIMAKALPALTKVVQFGNNFIKGLDPDKISSSIDMITGPISKVGQVVFDVGKIAYNAIQNSKPELEWLAQNGIPVITAVLSGLLDGATGVYNFIVNNWSNISPIVYGITAAMVAYTIAMEASNLATKAGLIIQGLSKTWWIATGIIGAMREGMTLAAIAQDALNVAMDANPVGVVCVAIGALIAIGLLLYNNWTEITTAVSNAWTWFTNIIDGMPDLTLALTGPLAPLLLLIKHFGQLKDLAIGAFDAVKNFFGFGSGSSDSGSDTGDVTGMKQYASGGISSVPAIFGEDGPEMAIPLKKTSRSLGLLSQTASMLGVGSAKQESASIQLTYAPQIYGGNTQEISSILSKHKDELRSMLEEIMNEKGRVSFG
ncbi:hypothetical protein D2A34_21905 [Clostridium chromiireducens]|uniref:Phage tail tape measure protein n=1 Tax=Clostridium chromiireducens TaxID=225345 RepID=A0A399IN32_9CLOT|nr:hypothetical protein [Clostridium chromiireducens]RII32852.1 hypothetical protein D2A34_21905 [Clostridium chromiireducens]